jgi:hypothetical protein
MVLSPVVIIFQVINAFSSLDHKDCISAIKLSKITIEIGKEIPFLSVNVQLFMFQTLYPCFLYSTKCGDRTIKNYGGSMCIMFCTTLENMLMETYKMLISEFGN